MESIFKVENEEIVPLMATDLNLGQYEDIQECIWNELDEHLEYELEDKIGLLEGVLLFMDDCGVSVMEYLDDNSDFCNSVVFYDGKVYKLRSLEYALKMLEGVE